MYLWILILPVQPPGHVQREIMYPSITVVCHNGSICQAYQRSLSLTSSHRSSVSISGFWITRLEVVLIFLLAMILCEIIQRLGTAHSVTVHRLADTSLKIVPTNLQSHWEVLHITKD